jgi:hypothetical protein
MTKLAQHFARRRLRRANHVHCLRGTPGASDAAVMSQAMVGRLLGLSRNQVKRIEHEAVQRIRQKLEGTWRQLIN